MLLRDLLDLRFCQRGKIRVLGGDHALKRLWMMGLQVLAQKVSCAALSFSMTDEDNRFDMEQALRRLLRSRTPPREHDRPGNGILCGG